MDERPDSLIEALTAALPADSVEKIDKGRPTELPLWPGFKGKVRYIHTPPKACDPLFSPPPGHEPEKTRLASHFLTVSVHPSRTAGTGSMSRDLEHHEEGVFGIGIEVLVYNSKHLTTIFVSKADTTGYLINHPPSRTKIVCTAFVKWLVDQERRKHPGRKTVVSLFARAQAQYLFPGSVDHGTKHVLDDRQLIKWWAKVLDPLLDTSNDTGDDFRVTGYLTIPGYDKQELKSYLPRAQHGNGYCWKPGHPLDELAKTRGLSPSAPPRSLLPRFPDDPKARFMQDLDDEVGLSEGAPVTVSPSKRKSGRWNNVRDLERFWEAMEFRQECSSGRVVGFLWVVISPGAEVASGASQESSQDILSSDPALARDATPTPSAPPSMNGSPKKRKRKLLTGPIIPRQPRLKGGSSSLTATSPDLNGMLNSVRGDGLLITKDGYDQAMQTLLHLDFANLDVAARSTSKWVAEVASISGLAGDWATEVTGTAKNAGEPKEKMQLPATNGNGSVNDLGSMVRRKRKAPDEAGSNGHAVAENREKTAGAETPAVNVLAAGAIRRKPKAAAP